MALLPPEVARRGVAYAFAVLVSAAALSVAAIVHPLLETYTTLPSAAAVLIASWYGGLGPGLVAGVLSTIGLNVLFVPPIGTVSVGAPGDAIRLLLFVGLSVLTGLVGRSLRRAREIAEQEAVNARAMATTLSARFQELTAYRAADRSLNERLALSDRRFDSLVQEISDYAIFALDPEGRVASWNVGAERMKGWREEEILGRPYSTFFSAADVARGRPAELLGAATHAGRVEGEEWRVRKDGSSFVAQFSLTAVHNEAGIVIGFTKVTRDVTERHVALAALRSANEEIATTVYAIAHGLRSPLRSMDGFAALLLRDHAVALPPDARGLLERIRHNAQRMGRMIDGLLALARLGRGELQRGTVDLGSLALRVVDELRRAEPDRQIEFVVSRGLRAVGDPRLLEDLMANLVHNAWKFTRRTQHARIEVGRRDGTGTIEYFVRDNGVGFDPAHASQLFRPFHRLHNEKDFEGTGIGLATVRRIVERHGGRVRAEGAPGRGACFSFTLGTDAAVEESIE